MAQSIDRRLAEDQTMVVGLLVTEPEAFSSTRSKPRKVPILDLKAAGALPVEVREDGVTPRVDSYAPCETGALQQRRRNGALVFKIGMARCILHPGIGSFGAHPVFRSRGPRRVGES